MFTLGMFWIEAHYSVPVGLLYFSAFWVDIVMWVAIGGGLKKDDKE